MKKSNPKREKVRRKKKTQKTVNEPYSDARLAFALTMISPQILT